MDTPFPPVPQGLLDRLAEVFPDRLPAAENLPHERFARLQGQQDVIRKLRVEYDRQQKNILNTHKP